MLQPNANDAESWCRLCFGRLQLKVLPLSGDGTDGEVGCLPNNGNGTAPFLSIVTRMDQVLSAAVVCCGLLSGTCYIVSRLTRVCIVC